MKFSHGLKVRSTFGLALGLGFCALLNLFWGHPGLPGGLSAGVCDLNGVCSYEEWDSKGTPTSQTCPDCRAKTYAPLAIDQFDAQIVTKGNDTAWSKYKVFQFKCVGTETIAGETFGTYADTWASLKTDTEFPAVCVGDADNDGQKEIVALLSGSKGQRIALFRSGSTGNPSWVSPYFAKGAGTAQSIRVGNVDRDNFNEIVMDIGDHVWICRIVPSGNSFGFSTVWTSPSYGVLIWATEIGDADNMGDNEIILAVFSYGAPLVLKFTGGTWQAQPIERITKPNVPAVDVAKVRDVDGTRDNEILACGNNNKVMVWKFDGSMYHLIAISEDLGGFTQGVDAGDIDPELSGNEIVTAAAALSGSPTASMAYVLKYSGGTLMVVGSTALPRVSEDICAMDLDGDGLCEIGINIYPIGLEIYEFVSANKTLIKRFSCIYGNGFDRGGRS